MTVSGCNHIIHSWAHGSNAASIGTNSAIKESQRMAAANHVRVAGFSTDLYDLPHGDGKYSNMRKFKIVLQYVAGSIGHPPGETTFMFVDGNVHTYYHETSSRTLSFSYSVLSL